VSPDRPVEVAGAFPPGKLSVTSEPAGATVSLVDGRPLGRAPLEVDLPPGTYDLRVDFGGIWKDYAVRISEGVTETVAAVYGGPTPGEGFTLEDPGMDLVWIEPGEFLMGSPSGESGRNSDEGPQTRVRISRGFWLGATEVTLEQYAAFLRATGKNSGVDWDDSDVPLKRSGYGLSGNKFGSAWDQPMVEVSWPGAVAFCDWLTERERAAGRLPEGYEYSLPREAEWEYAARAGTTTRYSFGNNDSDLAASGWYSGNAGGRTHGVGQKRPNAWGLYDMHGNVWEWCLDWYSDGYPGGSVTDYGGPASGSFRVNRGGSWYDPAQYCRSAYRFRNSPGGTYGNLGFRLALRPVR
jgi:formylglycine-generating enzyme required for sulfatase activity